MCASAKRANALRNSQHVHLELSLSAIQTKRIEYLRRGTSCASFKQCLFRDSVLGLCQRAHLMPKARTRFQPLVFKKVARNAPSVGLVQARMKIIRLDFAAQWKFSRNVARCLQPYNREGYLLANCQLHAVLSFCILFRTFHGRS